MLSGLYNSFDRCLRKPNSFLAIRQALLLSVAITKEEPKKKTVTREEEVETRQEQEDKETKTVENAATQNPVSETPERQTNRSGHHFPAAESGGLLPSLRSIIPSKRLASIPEEGDTLLPSPPLSPRITFLNQATSPPKKGSGVPAAEEQNTLARPSSSPRKSAGL
ncbi:MAG TPA: hypothetical protein VLI69_04935 [Gammaproteobacteria bacterium]|nr:hypothetical protein [Gammaproteobacteria bacterium]